MQHNLLFLLATAAFVVVIFRLLLLTLAIFLERLLLFCVGLVPSITSIGASRGLFDWQRDDGNLVFWRKLVPRFNHGFTCRLYLFLRRFQCRVFLFSGFESRISNFSLLLFGLDPFFGRRFAVALFGFRLSTLLIRSLNGSLVGLFFDGRFNFHFGGYVGRAQSTSCCHFGVAFGPCSAHAAICIGDTALENSISFLLLLLLN